MCSPHVVLGASLLTSAFTTGCAWIKLYLLPQKDIVATAEERFMLLALPLFLSRQGLRRPYRSVVDLEAAAH